MRLKKVILVGITLILVFSLCACNNAKDDKTGSTTDTDNGVQINNENTDNQPQEKDSIKAVEKATVQYNNVEPFYSNVILFRNGGNCGVLNNDGNVRVEAKYAGLKPISPLYMMYKISEVEINAIGLMTTDGKELLACEYDDVKYISDDYLLLTKYYKTESKDTASVSDSSGNYSAAFSIYSVKKMEVLDYIDLTEFSAMAECFAVEDCILLSGTTGFGNNVKAYIIFIDALTNESKLNSDEITHYSSGYYYHDNDTQREIDIKWWNAFAQNASADKKYELIPCLYKMRLGYINSSGETIIDFQYTNLNEIYYFGDNGIVPVEKDGYWGFVNSKGETVCDYIYDDVGKYGFVDGYCPVKMNNKWGYVDTAGKQTVNAAYTKSDRYSLYFKDKSNQTYLVNPKTSEKHEYNHISETGSHSIFIIEQNELYGLATSFGLLVESQYEYKGTFVSQDGSVFVGRKGNSSTIYTII